MQALSNLFFDVPLAVIALLMAAVMFAFARLGWWIGRGQRRRAGDEDEKSVDVILGTLLALLGLLIAFTYSFALERHAARKASILLEANALGTAFLRADLLEDEPRRRLQTALEAYAKTRTSRGGGAAEVVTAEAYETAIAVSESVQRSVWPAALAAAATVPPPYAALIITSVNEVLDSHTIRAAALRDRVPAPVFLLAVLVACSALFTSSQAAGYRGDRRVWRSLAYALTVTAILTLIMDFDRPARGFITVSAQPIDSAWESMAAGLQLQR
ncbi:MAG: hypothetical protein AAGI51_08185 [Pseudomonadota bacterium]